jgi:hypothetical protein
MGVACGGWSLGTTAVPEQLNAALAISSVMLPLLAGLKRSFDMRPLVTYSKGRSAR